MIEGGAQRRAGSLSVDITDPTGIGFEFLKPVPDTLRSGNDTLAAQGGVRTSAL